MNHQLRWLQLKLKHKKTVADTLEGVTFSDSGTCKTTDGNAASWTGLNNSDYDTCSYTITNGTASVTLKGKGKFAGYTCTGTRTGITGECKKSS